MDLDHLSSAGTDAAGGDPFGGPATHHTLGARTRALAGLSADTSGGVQFSWVFTTITRPHD